MASPSKSSDATEADSSSPQGEVAASAHSRADKDRDTAEAFRIFADNERQRIRAAQAARRTNARQQVWDEFRTVSQKVKLPPMPDDLFPICSARYGAEQLKAQEEWGHPYHVDRSPSSSAESMEPPSEPSLEPSPDSSPQPTELEEFMWDCDDLMEDLGDLQTNQEMRQMALDVYARIWDGMPKTGLKEVYKRLKKLAFMETRCEAMRMRLKYEIGPRVEGSSTENEPRKERNAELWHLLSRPLRGEVLTPEMQKSLYTLLEEESPTPSTTQEDLPKLRIRKSKPVFRDRDEAREFFNSVFSKENQDRVLGREGSDGKDMKGPDGAS